MLCGKDILLESQVNHHHLRSLHDVRDLNAYRTNDVCLSVCMFGLENCRTDFDIGVNVVPSEAAPKSYFLLPCSR